MTFTLTIDLGNDAMQTPADVAGILRGMLADDTFDSVDPFERDTRKVFDANGNSVGKWEVK